MSDESIFADRTSLIAPQCRTYREYKLYSVHSLVLVDEVVVRGGATIGVGGGACTTYFQIVGGQRGDNLKFDPHTF